MAKHKLTFKANYLSLSLFQSNKKVTKIFKTKFTLRKIIHQDIPIITRRKICFGTKSKIGQLNAYSRLTTKDQLDTHAT